MKKLIIFSIIIIVVVVVLMVKTPSNNLGGIPEDYKVTLDVSGWKQEEKNAVHSITSLLLFQNNITHEGIKVIGGEVQVIQASEDISTIITEAEILDAYAIEEGKRQDAAQDIVDEKTDAKSKVDASDLSNADKKKIKDLIDD